MALRPDEITSILSKELQSYEKRLEVDFDHVVAVDGYTVPSRFTVHGPKGSSTVVEVPEKKKSAGG